MGLFNKKELAKIAELEEEINNYKKRLEDIGAMEYSEIMDMITTKKNDLIQLNDNINNLNIEIDNLNKEIKDKKLEMATLDDDIIMQEFGFYKPKYNCMNSEEYSLKIKDIRNQQKLMIKNKTALDYYDDWTLNGSKAQGRAMNNDNMKMVLRAFNNECDVLINKVKFNNIERIEERIKKAATQIDNLNKKNRITITFEYLNLKLDELHLAYEYTRKKQEEKEAMRAAREEEREQAKLQKEIQEARKSIAKEQKHYENAKEKLISQLANCSNVEKAKDIQSKIDEIDNKLAEIQKNLEDIDFREANKRAGYVYVISNIGSFGEGVYKIGMTRRLEPMDRVDELGDASVPFKFDVHAMIFSDDAPKLENALHKAFENKKVNMINGRKEFFKVSLDEIEKVVKENHEKLIEFNKVADAEQYRETVKILEMMNK